jgi:hypothetical protein
MKMYIDRQAKIYLPQLVLLYVMSIFLENFLKAASGVNSDFFGGRKKIFEPSLAVTNFDFRDSQLSSNS